MGSLFLPIPKASGFFAFVGRPGGYPDNGQNKNTFKGSGANCDEYRKNPEGYSNKPKLQRQTSLAAPRN